MNRNLLIVGVIIAAALFFGGFHFPGAVGGSTGFSTMSLTTGTSYTAGAAYPYTVAIQTDGSSGSLQGTFTPAQMASFTGVLPSSQFSVAANVAEQCTDALLSGATPVYSYSWSPVTSNNGGAGSCSFYTLVQSGCQMAYVGQGSSCGNQQIVCANVVATKIGDIYLLDTVNHYTSQINISLTASNSTYTIPLSNSNKNGEIVGAMKASYVSNSVGDFSCPTAAVDTVLYRPVNTNQLIPKNRAYYNDLFLYSTNPPSASTGISAANSEITQFLASTAPTSAYCPAGTNGQTSTYFCNPTSQVVIQNILLNLAGQTIGAITPSGTPKIISLSNPVAEAATTTDYNVTLQNAGTSTDSFDLSIAGTPSVSLESSRTSIAAGAQATIPIKVQGAGIIGQYTLKATSANDPTKSDSLPFTLEIAPYCDKTGLPGQVKVNTEYGCQFICQGEYSGDLREKGCVQFGSFEVRGAYNTFQQTGVNTDGSPIFSTIAGLNGETHCTGIGTYASLTDYMNYVYSPSVQYNQLIGSINQSRIFVPQQINGAVWLSSPVCNYAGLYGYTFKNGQVSTVSSASYASVPQPASGVLTPTGSATITTLQSTTSVCPAGDVYDSASGQCQQYQNTTIILSPNYVCPSGTTLDQSNGTVQCDITPTTSVICPTGTYNPVTQHCEIAGQQQVICPTNYALSNGTCMANGIISASWLTINNLIIVVVAAIVGWKVVLKR